MIINFEIDKVQALVQSLISGENKALNTCSGSQAVGNCLGGDIPSGDRCFSVVKP